MRILIVGASGFIGSHLVTGLSQAGHEAVCAGRNPAALRRRFPACVAVRCDLAADSLADWSARLAGIEAVINAAGILRGDFDGVQSEGPIRLFEACAAADMAHVIQISGLGATRGNPASFLNTKVPADERLRDLAAGRSWSVLRPGVVIGAGGQSTALFAALAAFPWPIGIGDGQSRLSVVAVAEIVAVAAALLQRPAQGFLASDLVAPGQVTTDALTLQLRTWLGLPPRRMLRIPYRLLSLFAGLGLGSLTPETLAMLRAGLAGDARPLEAVLGRPIAPLADALAARPATRADNLAAHLFWLHLPRCFFQPEAPQ